MKTLRLLVALVALFAQTAFTQSANHVVISEVYGGGGNTGATLKNDFIELYNPTDIAVSLSGWSVQYVSATGTVPQKTFLSGSIQPKSFFLIQEAQGAGGTQNLPTPDVTGIIPMSATGAKVVLARDTISVVNPTDANVVDFVGYGTADKFEGTAAVPLLTNTTSAERKASASSTATTMGSAGSEERAGNGYDSNNNLNDFVIRSSPDPQNSASLQEPVPVGGLGSGTAAITPTRWKYNASTTIQIIFKPQADTVRGIRFVKPPTFTWSGGNIIVQSGTKTQSVDTTTISAIALKGSDSLIVTITAVTAVDTTDQLAIEVRSSKDGAVFAPIEKQPATLVYGEPRTMATVKQKDGGGTLKLLNKWAVVRGIVTVGGEFISAPNTLGGPAYLQDATAAVAVFDSSVSFNVSRGDDIAVLGLVTSFNELFEMNPGILLQKFSEGNGVDTLVLTAVQINSQTSSEPYESRLVRVNGIDSVTNVLSSQRVNSWAASVNYYLNGPTGQVQVRISPSVNLVGLPTPSGKFDCVGVLGQFQSTYQLMPRLVDDLIFEAAGPRIMTQAPYESNMTSSSIRLTWQTDLPSTSTLRFGKTTAYGTEIADTNKVTQHTVIVTGLSPATIYDVQLASTGTSGTTTSPNAIVSTSSKTSTGVINVYFNKSVNTTLARTDTAKTVNLSSKAIERINAAKFSIDCALYSLSGTVGANVANALIAAKNRGVNVRMIVEEDNSGTVAMGTAKANLPFITDKFDPINNGLGLHHNKFFVIDYRDTTLDTDDWVWMGSWNATDPGTDNDRQNAIEIQDQALAAAYTREFEEMWGSTNETPVASNSRFGARKLDNTPHLFIIGGVPIESYFSPSDRVTSQIIRTLGKAQHSIAVCMYSFTRSDIAQALVAKKVAGERVRVVMDNNTDSGNQFAYLGANSVDLLLKSFSPGLLHHKYAIVDAENGSYPQYVITGSHNWSSAAENSNNENTLIIQSNRIANLYLQEFYARYKESGGTGTIVVSVEQFNPSTEIRFTIHDSRFTSLKVYDVLGREVATLVNEEKTAGVYHVTWDAGGMASGVYMYRMTAGAYVEAKKMLLLR